MLGHQPFNEGHVRRGIYAVVVGGGGKVACKIVKEDKKSSSKNGISLSVVAR
jgi:hypothetical protein